MKKPFVISVSSLSGGGKTTVVAALKERLNNSTGKALSRSGGCVHPVRTVIRLPL